MAIEIEKRFTLDAPVDRVWAFLVDLQRVAECLKGATVSGRDDDGVWSGTMKVKLGPVSSSYRGTARFVEVDEDAHTVELTAEGRDTRGKGGADMTMRSALTGSGGGTEVHVASTVHVTGVLARMGRGMIEDVSDQLFEQFSECVREKLEGEPVAGAATGVDEAGPGEAEPPEPEASATHAEDGEQERGPSRESEEALQLGGVGARAGGRALGRLLRRPSFWILVVVVALAAWAVVG